jgi:serine phosphatase RsbU (regulator of sigma subunit)/anti-sigma regulatory factor (Ser/Thr protein kinase)
MPVGRINDIMTNHQAWSDVGLGQSGETYIVGSDSTMRNQSRFLIEDRHNYLATISRLGMPPETVARIEKHNSSIGLHEVDTYGTQTAVAGKSGTAVFPDYRGVDVLSSFRPLDLQDLDWVVMSEIDKDEAFEVFGDVRETMIIVGSVLLALTVGLSYVLSSSLTRPLRKLEGAAASLASGNLDEPVERSTQDEIGDLAEDFDRMRISLRDSFAEIERKNDELEDRVEERTLALKRQKDRMEEELNIGREIQQSLLPLIFPAFPEYDEFKVWASLQPARELGGDFYDFYFLDKHRFCFCIGDVSGKGVPSALFMAVAKTFVKLTAGDEFSPARILSYVNQELSRGNTSAMFVTLFLGILDIKTGKLIYSNGGHNPPYLLRASNGPARLDERHGPAVGALPGMSYKETVMMLSPGDMLFMYTDGVTEALDREENFFTEARLADLLRAQKAVHSKDIVESVLADVDRFAQGAEQADDITVLGVEFRGPKEGMDHVLALSMRNQASEMNGVQQRFASFASQHALAESDTQRIGMVLDELLSNVISYGYTDELEHTIELKFELSAQELAITIEDDGIPFNPFSTEPPDTSLPLEDRPIGGVGIHLVRNVMDRFHYQRRAKRNIVTLKKRIGAT